MRSLVLRTAVQRPFDQSEPSVVPSKELLRTQAIIETLVRSEKIRRPSELSAL
jgi:hypothetical protein